MPPADNIGARAERARWEFHARRERDRARHTLLVLQRLPNLGWCGFDESSELDRDCASVGRSPTRVIQQWHDIRQLIAAAGSAELADLGSCTARFLDYPRAGWAWISPSDSLLPLLESAPDMTDGFIFFVPESRSVLSVDVERSADSAWLETTVIGPAFDGLRAALSAGPAPMQIAQQDP
jgi:hypothetical protein